MYSKRYFEDYHFGELKNQKSLNQKVEGSIPSWPTIENPNI
jgi:hypothetical protein